MQKQGSVDKLFYEKACLNKLLVTNQHHHDFFEIYYLEEGRCNYFIDNDTYEVKQGDIVIIPAGIIHKTMYTDEENAKRRLIYCSPIHISTAVFPYLSAIPYIYRNRKVSERVRELLDAIESEYFTCDAFSEDLLLNYMNQLFFLIARNPDVEAPRRTESAYTTKTIIYIKDNYAENIRLTDLADKCSVSPEHLSRIFKKDTGFGISEYISIIRLQQAQYMLRNAEALSVIEIAQKCGFNDSNYFSKKFKQMYGTSPLKYRKCVNK